ncbi:hypothetical protein HDU89_005805 [Geranomyces variabilis]|nr:hypothetical protein HDU89_005805 [Geranomyces variabilis]
MATIPHLPSPEQGRPSSPLDESNSSRSPPSPLPPPPLSVVTAIPVKLPRAPPAVHHHQPSSSASALAADSSYMQSVFSALEDAEIARGVPHTVLEMQTAREGGATAGPTSSPQFDEARGKQLFAVYRSRLRRTYILPLVTWLPSFGLILLYAVKFTDGTRTWVVVSGIVWLCLLFGTWLAYRAKVLRLKKIHSLGLLGTLPSDEVNDVVMNGRALRTPPVYDWEEPLPPYMTGDGAGATTTTTTAAAVLARRSASVRSFWTARTAAGSVNGGGAAAAATTTTPAAGTGTGLRRWWTASSSSSFSASTAPSPTSFSPISVTSIANIVPPTASSGATAAAAAANVDEIRVEPLSRAPTASPPPYTTTTTTSAPLSRPSSPSASSSRNTPTPTPAVPQPSSPILRSANLPLPDVAPAATI